MQFYRKDTPTIMSGLVVRYRVFSDHYNGEISASRDGVLIQGAFPSVMAKESIDEICAVLQRAHEQFDKALRKKYQTALPFDGDPECVREYREYRFGILSEYTVIAYRSLQDDEIKITHVKNMLGEDNA